MKQQLIRAIEQSGETRYRIAQETGLAESVLSRLVNGTGDPRLSTVQRLADHLGLELRPAGRGRSKKGE